MSSQDISHSSESKILHTEFYSIIGKLTVLFARMEGDLRALISGLAFAGASVTASTFLDSSQLLSNLKTLRKIARQYPEHEEGIKNLASSIERIRQDRNLFIHGIWNPNTFDTVNGAALVKDLNTNYEISTNSRSWTSGRSRSFQYKDFTDIYKKIVSIVREIESIMKSLENDPDYEFEFEMGSSSHTKIESFLLDDSPKEQGE
ncbi:hypothetical protein [Rubritalea squalenifaciens]|uniref:hypothetical protein n=1 Tax=Rubritalea squalenifaciens TaxID=407226 RepID=UPI001160D914|nr:hypothetical protein [Rubritalea squalenifaciens]